MLKRRRFFFRLFALYVILVLVYSLIASNILFSKNKEVYETEIIKNKEMFLNQSAGEMDDKLKVAFNLVTKLRTDGNIRNYMEAPAGDSYFAIQVENELAKMQSSFSDIGFYIAVSRTDEDCIISAESTSGTEFYFRGFGAEDITRQHIRENVQALQENGSLSPYVIKVTSVEEIGKKVPYLTLVKEEKTNSGRAFYVYITFRLENFLPVAAMPEGEDFAIVNNGETVYSTAQERQEETNGTDRRFQRISKKSSVMKWEYVYRYSCEYKGVARVSGIIICFLLLLAGGAAGFLILRKLYRPLDDVVNVLRPFGAGDTQARDELSYIQETTLRLTDANDRLRRILDENRTPLKENFLRNLIHGLADRQTVTENLKKYNLEILEKPCRTIVMEICNYEQIQNSFSKEDILAIQMQIISIAEERLRDEFRVTGCREDYRRIVFLAADGDWNRLENALKHIVLDLEANFEIVVVCAVGVLCSGAMAVSDSYRSAELALDNRLYRDRRAVIDAGSRQADMSDFDYPVDTEKELIQAILRNNGKEAHRLLNKVIEDNLKKRSLDKASSSAFILAISNTINRILQLSGKKIEEVLPDGTIVYVELKMQPNADALVAAIYKMFDAVIEKIDADSRKSDSDVKELMFDYIHENYSRDIALADLAEHFNFSRTYISTLFKELTGYNFKDYLNMYRVQEAKRILEEEPHIKINDLAVRLGFNSANTFIRIFNKYEKLSPGQYLKKNLMNRNE